MNEAEVKELQQSVGSIEQQLRVQNMSFTAASASVVPPKDREATIRDLVGMAEAAASAAAAAAVAAARVSRSSREPEEEGHLTSEETGCCYWASKLEEANRERADFKARWDATRQELDQTRRTVAELQQQLAAVCFSTRDRLPSTDK